MTPARRAVMAILGLVTLINVGAAAISLYTLSVARADFRRAAEPIAKLGVSILEAINELNQSERDRVEREQ